MLYKIHERRIISEEDRELYEEEARKILIQRSNEELRDYLELRGFDLQCSYLKGSDYRNYLFEMAVDDYITFLRDR